MGGDLAVVGDEDERRLVLALEAGKKLHHLSGILAVEIPRGFIREQNPGAVGEAAGDGCALPLTAGEFDGKMMQAMRKADRIQQLRSPCGAELGRQALAEHGDLDVFNNRERAQKVERLKNKPDLAGAVASGVWQSGHRFATID